MIVCAKYWGGIQAHTLIEAIHSVPQGCVGVSDVTMQSSIVTGSEIGIAGHGSLPYKGRA